MMAQWFAPGCARIRRDIVAWIDGGLRAGRARRISAHLRTCRVCAVEAEAVRASVEAQRQLLQARLAAEPVDLDRLWQQFGRRLRGAEPGPSRAAVPAWLWRPALLFAAASVVLWFGSAAVLEEPSAVLISMGVKAPPAKLKQEPDLFKDYAIIEDLDVLERFDTVDAEPADAAMTPAADQG